jgi:hypothetical protein
VDSGGQAERGCVKSYKSLHRPGSVTGAERDPAAALKALRLLGI